MEHPAESVKYRGLGRSAVMEIQNLNNPSENRLTTENTLVTDHELGLSQKPYRPARWQSNLTILSCVSSLPLLYKVGHPY